MIGELVVLRLVHILGGLFWAGAGIFSAVFLAPALAKAGPAGGQVMAGLQERRLFTVMPAVALLTILSGLRLMWILSDDFAAAYFATRTGQVLAVSGGLALIAFLVSFFLIRPIGSRAGALRARLAAESEESRVRLSAELDRLQRRANAGGFLNTVLLVLAAAGMAVARYLT